MNSLPLEITAQKKHELLSVIQSDFPIVSRPFKVLADSLGLTERKVMSFIIFLKEEGIIRTFGPVFEASRLGYVSTLIAAKVDTERIADISVVMLDINEITHNYLRDNEYNLWFTIIARNSEIAGDIINRIKKLSGVEKVLNLPARKVFKIDAVWAGGKSKNTRVDNKTGAPPLNESEKSLVGLLQNDFPVVKNPFRVLSDSIQRDESEIIDTINLWINNGIIRRFGARLNHKKIGYTFNTLAAWQGKDLELWGKKFAELNQVSHCYLREPHEDWPYELYTMIHAKSAPEADIILETMSGIAHRSKMITLNTLYELKKTSMKYFMED